MTSEHEWISLSEAADRLGVHRNTMTRRVTLWKLHTRQNPLNLRETLVDWEQIKLWVDGIDLKQGAA